MYHASVTPVPANSQHDWRTVHYYLHVDTPQTGTGHHCSHAHIETLAGDYWKSHISRWNMVSQDRHAMTSQRQHARWFSLDIRIVRAILGLTTLRVQSKFFKRKNMSSNMVCSGSDSCRLCQFRWASAERTALPRSMWRESGRSSPLVCVCICVCVCVN